MGTADLRLPRGLPVSDVSSWEPREAGWLGRSSQGLGIRHPERSLGPGEDSTWEPLRTEATRTQRETQAPVTFSWLKASIRFMAVSKAVTIFRKSWSCSQRGLDSKSKDILTADLDMAVRSQSSVSL